MDWFSWLSKSSLEPSLIYEYGLAFARNELQAEDVTHFNHEFLQSMGISVAKHRLEILKLARKEIAGRPNGFSRLILAMNKTKRCLTKYVNKLVFHEDSALVSVPRPIMYRAQWKGPMSRNHKNATEIKREILITSGVSGPLDGRVHEKWLFTNRSPRIVSGPLDGRVQDKPVFVKRPPKVVSGPLDRRVQQKLMTNRSPTVSGPLDLRVQDKLMIPNRSPCLSGPLDGKIVSPIVHDLCCTEKMETDDGLHSIWATLFQDMKPT